MEINGHGVNRQALMKSIENQQKSMKINGKPMETNELRSFSMIFIDFEESGERKVMKIGVKVDKRGKERLREQKNEYNRVNETPSRAPGTPKVRFLLIKYLSTS